MASGGMDAPDGKHLPSLMGPEFGSQLGNKFGSPTGADEHSHASSPLNSLIELAKWAPFISRNFFCLGRPWATWKVGIYREIGRSKELRKSRHTCSLQQIQTGKRS